MKRCTPLLLFLAVASGCGQPASASDGKAPLGIPRETDRGRGPVGNPADGTAGGSLQETNATRKAVDSLAAHLDGFRLDLKYHGADRRVKRWISLMVSPTVDNPPSSRKVVRVPEERALMILGYLASDGLLYRGTVNRVKLLVLPKGPYCTVNVRAREGDEYFEHVPSSSASYRWHGVTRPPLAAQLDRLRLVCSGEAAEVVDQLAREVRADLSARPERASPAVANPGPEASGAPPAPAKAPSGGSPITFNADQGIITIDPKADARDKRQFGMAMGSITVETFGHDKGEFVFEYTCEIELGSATYRCRIPADGPPATIEIPKGGNVPKTSFDLEKCEVVRTGNLRLAGSKVIFAGPSEALLKGYRGQGRLPKDLYDTYAELVKAIETADQADIQGYCLPHSVTFTTGVRPEKSREYGADMNIPFLKKGFRKDILNLRKDSEDTYLIRTGTSYLFFVRTKTTGWKLYRYGDKPIE